jgi:glycosyltransferase involved in cell wall biosynthesis
MVSGLLLCIVIPVYNEEATLPRLLARLDATPSPMDPETGAALRRKIVIVDDGSGDATPEIVGELQKREDVTAVFQRPNQGKGAALRAGFAAALALGADVVLIQDGDLESDPADHETALEPILEGRADVVIGSRFIGQSHRVMYFWHWVANQAITQLCNMLTNLNLTDIECGIKAFRREVAEQLTISEDRFGVEPEIVAKVARMRIADRPAPRTYWRGPAGDGRPRRLRIYEVPVSYAGRTYEEGKKIGWRDGISALRCVVKYTLLTRAARPADSSPRHGRGGTERGPAEEKRDV